MLDEMKNETKKLNSLIDSLIKLSDIWDLKWWKAKVNLKDLVNEILNKFKENISKKAIQVNVKIRKDILIEANRDYFYILLSNLIWNAVKYNMNDWKIDISYKDNQLTIKDSWVWIPTDDFNKIFDRFYKVDESRNTEGFGIWLSLVKKIVDIYSWDIEVDSEDWEGSSFVLSFR
jgi:two-component system phosphate regulon sensor histidine kinase PhoR